MAPPIVLKSRPDRSPSMVQLKTRVSPDLKRQIGLLAIERDRPLQHEVHDALVAHLVRVKGELVDQAERQLAASAE